MMPRLEVLLSTKLLAHLAPVPGAEPELAARLLEVARGLEAASLWRGPRDPFGAKTPWCGTLELRGSEAKLLARAAGLSARFAGLVDAAASTALVGHEHVFIASERAPVRYQYLMRRRADFSHEAYLARNRDVHAQFGLRTPGILGYVQLHVDPAASRRAADASGFGVCDVDSVSELHLASLGEFLRAVSTSSIGAEAVADEERFVDRARSFDFCSHVTWHERSTA
jgi:EthD domain